MLRNTLFALQDHAVQSSDMHYLTMIGWQVERMKKEAKNLEKAEEMNLAIQSLTEESVGIFKSDLKLIKTARIAEVSWEEETNSIWGSRREEPLKSCVIEMGYSMKEVEKEIPEFFEGHVPVLIAEYGASHIKIKLTNEVITFEGTGNDSTFCVTWDCIPMKSIWDCFPFIRMFENFHKALKLIVPIYRWHWLPQFPIMADMSSTQKIAIHENSCYLKKNLLRRVMGMENVPETWSRESCLYVQKTLDGEEEVPKTRCRSVLNYWKNECKKERKMLKRLAEANCKVKNYYLENGRVNMEKAEKALARSAKRRKLA